MRSLEEITLVRDLVAQGLNDCAIVRLTDLPRSTVRDWRTSKRWAPRQRIPGISTPRTQSHGVLSAPAPPTISGHCRAPQHAPGPKHEREIALADWQQSITARRPDLFIRGLIHSDGCRSLNTIHHPKKTYRYPRYTFTQRSDDIRQIFCDTCDLLGIEWRVMNAWNISVARRDSVAKLDEFVGPKA